jgi:uncharacterized protein (UPF0333 family)
MARRVHPPFGRKLRGGEMKIFRNRRGQSATEYMLVIAVVVLGLVAAASHFIPQFNAAVAQLAQNVAGWITTNQEMANAN